MLTLAALSKQRIFLDDPVQNARGLKLYPAKLATREPVKFFIGPRGTFPATIPWEPSAFQGTGDEERKTVTFNLDEQTWQAFKELEDSLVAALGNIPAWCSALKESKTGVKFVRCKINTAGLRQALVVDEDGAATTLPTPWWKCDANAQILCRGAYQQGKIYGPLLEAISLQIAKPVGPATLNPWVVDASPAGGREDQDTPLP